MAYKNKEDQLACQRRWYQRNKGQIKSMTRNQKSKIRNWFVSYKKTLQCEKCAEDDFRCLDFHHLDHNDKKINVSMMVTNTYSIKSIKKEIEKRLKRIKRISTKRFFKLMTIGFFVAFATVIDDTIAYSALFLGPVSNAPLVVGGIFSATVLQLGVLVYFSKKVMKIKYKKEITVVGLTIIGFLILFKIL